MFHCNAYTTTAADRLFIFNTRIFHCSVGGRGLKITTFYAHRNYTDLMQFTGEKNSRHSFEFPVPASPELLGNSVEKLQIKY